MIETIRGLVNKTIKSENKIKLNYLAVQNL